jgi:hypothetical protein
LGGDVPSGTGPGGRAALSWAGPRGHDIVAPGPACASLFFALNTGIRCAGAGDWLSGRAPRSHRGGHWFDPSIAHPGQLRSCGWLFLSSRGSRPSSRPPRLRSASRVMSPGTRCRPQPTAAERATSANTPDDPRPRVHTEEVSGPIQYRPRGWRWCRCRAALCGQCAACGAAGRGLTKK